jgi:4-amino-4-deoxy-L-arabinose transferase-like glycosyltransferase
MITEKIQKALNEHSGISVVCAVYLVVSLLFFGIVLKGVPHGQNDTPSYVNTAHNILAKGFVSEDGVNPGLNRTPGYPLFLALVYGLGGNDAAVVVVQILLSMLGLYILYRTLVLLNVSRRMAALGTAFLLLNITTYEWTFYLMTEFLFSFCLLLSVYFLARYFHDNRRFVWFALFSIAVNYALFTRPVSIYFNLLTAVVLLVLSLIRRLKFRCSLVFLICFVLVFGGWSFRNYRYTSVFVYSTIQSHNIKDYYCTMITARIENISEEEALAWHNAKFREEYPQAFNSGLNEAQVSALEGKYGSAYIRRHFSDYLALNVKGFFTMMLRPVVRNVLSGIIPNVLVVLLICALVSGYLLFTYLMYIAGFIVTIKKTNAVQVYILLLCAYLAAASAILGYARLRAPFFPLLLLSAASNFPALLHWLNARAKIPVLYRLENYIGGPI